MATPATRTPVRIARGAYSDLNASIADLQEGEICYATDQNKVYVVESATLIPQPYTELDVAQTWTKGQRGEITALTDGATITPDFADSNNYSVTLGGNRTLANPSRAALRDHLLDRTHLQQEKTPARTRAAHPDRVRVSLHQQHHSRSRLSDTTRVN